ncbi:MAG: beta-propeller repeat protein [Bryobacterales bacterium]|nr:beta-propeller repeat protein [Bryobacterales bacterium]
MRLVKSSKWTGLAFAALMVVGCASRPEAPTGYRIFVANETSGDMTVIDSRTMEPVGPAIPLGKRPRGMHASPDGKLIYIALSGTPPAPPGVDEDTLPPPDKSADGIAVFDVASLKVLRTIKAGSDPENFDISHDGKFIYVSNEDIGGVGFVDIAAGKVVNSVKTGEEPEGVTVTPDGKLIYSTNEGDGTITIIDPNSAKLLKTFKVGRRPRNIVFLPDGKHGYVNAENDGTVVYFDAEKGEVVKSIELGTPGEVKPMGLALSPDSKKLFVSTGRGHKVFVIDTATNQSTANFEVGQRPWGIATSPDGTLLFTANGPSGDVSVIDIATNTVKKKIKGGSGTYSVVVLPN